MKKKCGGELWSTLQQSLYKFWIWSQVGLAQWGQGALSFAAVYLHGGAYTISGLFVCEMRNWIGVSSWVVF